MKAFIYNDFPLGAILIGERNNSISYLMFADQEETRGVFESGYLNQETRLIRMAKSQLEEYFEGKRKNFDMALSPEGTEFQKKVWMALLEIPYGETRSYKEIGERIGCPKGSRAVGFANNRNPISIMIPCHRVIGSDGSLIGYGGGLENKKKLLLLEEHNCHR